MNRDAAIEAAATALQRIARDAHPHVAATVAVDAAAPHLVGEPVGWAVATPLGGAAIICASLDEAQHLRDVLSEGSKGGLRIVALVHGEDMP